MQTDALPAVCSGSNDSLVKIICEVFDNRRADEALNAYNGGLSR